MDLWIFLGVIVLLGLLVLLVFLSKRVEGNYSLKSYFLTKTEASTLLRLQKRFSGFYFFPKVRMLDVVVPERRNDFRSLGKITGKKIDLLVVDKNFKPVVALVKDAEVKAILEKAGLNAVSTEKELSNKLNGKRERPS
jgi:hypothetical protein